MNLSESLVDILLVEDNPSDAELALRSLKKHNVTNRIIWVKDGEEALDFLFHRGTYAESDLSLPKVVLLDLRLPKVDGIEVLKQIRGCASTALSRNPLPSKTLPRWSPTSACTGCW